MNVSDSLKFPQTELQLRQHLSQRLRFNVGEHDGDYSRNPDFKDLVINGASRDAAVLVPLVERANGMHVVLTKRTEHLSSHSGQVAFPGGKIDPEDLSAEHAAIREAHEEIDLAPDLVEVVGKMPDYYSGSGYKIAPILGIVAPDAAFNANPNEVDYVFEVPLHFLMDPQNHHEGSRVFNGARRYYLEMPYGEHYIWGVTAGIIRCIYDRVFT